MYVDNNEHFYKFPAGASGLDFNGYDLKRQAEVERAKPFFTITLKEFAFLLRQHHLRPDRAIDMAPMIRFTKTFYHPDWDDTGGNTGRTAKQLS